MISSRVKTSKDRLFLYSGYWSFALLLVMISIFLFNYIEAIKVPNLFNLQFANMDSERFFLEEVDLNQEVLSKNLLFDFGFIVLYTLLFWLSIKIFDLTLLLNLTKKIYYLVLIPGVFDVIENICLFSLMEKFTTSFFHVLWWVVRLKWLFLIPFIIINIIIILYYIVNVLNYKISEKIDS